MKFILFLIIFGVAFAFFTKSGIRIKYLVIAFIVSFAIMMLLRISGGLLVDTLGTGLNTFLMIYDILAAFTYKRPQSTPNMPERAEDCEKTEDIDCAVTEDTDCAVTEDIDCAVTEDTDCAVTEDIDCAVTEDTDCAVTEDTDFEKTEDTEIE